MVFCRSIHNDLTLIKLFITSFVSRKFRTQVFFDLHSNLDIIANMNVPQYIVIVRVNKHFFLVLPISFFIARQNVFNYVVYIFKVKEETKIDIVIWL